MLSFEEWWKINTPEMPIDLILMMEKNSKKSKMLSKNIYILIEQVWKSREKEIQDLKNHIQELEREKEIQELRNHIKELEEEQVMHIKILTEEFSEIREKEIQELKQKIDKAVELMSPLTQHLPSCVCDCMDYQFVLDAKEFLKELK